MVDVGRDYSPSGGYFLAHHLGCDVGVDAERLIVEILTDSHILHFRSDYALTGKGHLCDGASFFGTARRIAVGEAYGVEAFVGFALASVLRGYCGQLLEIFACCNPFFTRTRDSTVDVDGN